MTFLRFQVIQYSIIGNRYCKKGPENESQCEGNPKYRIVKFHCDDGYIGIGAEIYFATETQWNNLTELFKNYSSKDSN